MSYFLARLSERSTFAGLGALIATFAPMLGIAVNDELISTAITAITGVAGFLLMVFPTGSRTPPV